MTTVAYRAGVVAADTAMSRGFTIQTGLRKVARRDDGALVGICGSAGWGHAFIRWFLAGEEGDRPKGEYSDQNCDAALVARPNGDIEVFEGEWSYVVEAPRYYAMGSGRDQALGAMFAGLGAEAAVRAAIAHDAHTGGDVTAVRL